MARRKRCVFRIIGWIVFGFFSLILVITLVFYLGRGWIMNRAVTYLNDQQPGEITMGQMNLIPLVNFPDVTLQLRHVNYYERDLHPDSLYLEPIISLNDIYVRLDVVELIRGNMKISQVRIGKGFIRYEIYDDSISNFERALGIRFGEGEEKDSTVLPGIRMDLDRLELSDVLVLVEDHPSDNHIQLQINRWESSFNYLPERIHAELKLDMDINYLKYLTYRSEVNRNIWFESEVLIDPVRQEIHIEPSAVRISGLELETWGSYTYREVPHIDMAFRATNEGLEVLNYLFKGILDLDEIEQIGAGQIHLGGYVTGDLHDRLPVVRMNGSADGIGFRIKPMQNDVRDISFQFYATNGMKPDMSEGSIQVSNFSATFPEGTIQGDLWAVNMVAPELSLRLNGDIELTGLEQMLKTKVITGMEGKLAVEGEVNGVIDRKNEEFLNDSSTFRMAMKNVGFTFTRDSMNRDSVRGMTGEILVRQDFIETGDLQLGYNGNQVWIRATLAQLIPILMGYDTVLDASLTLRSEEFHPGSILRDTLITGRLGETWKNVHFKLGARVPAKELKKFLDDDSIPRATLVLDSFGIKLPVYAEIKDLSASFITGKDTISVDQLKGTVGDSHLDFSGSLVNYDGYLKKDTGAMVQFDWRISSDTLYASDLFTLDTSFLLPGTFRSEYLDNFKFNGSLKIPVAELMAGNESPDFDVTIHELKAGYSGYPLPVKQFVTRIRREGERLMIDQLQGKIGNSDLKLSAMMENFTDTVLSNIKGTMVLESDLLDLNELLALPLPGITVDSIPADTAGKDGLPLFYEFDYPDFEFTLDIGDLRYSLYNMEGIQGKFRTSHEKIFYFDQFHSVLERGGSLQFSGQLNVSDPDAYILSSSFDVKDIDLNKFDFEMLLEDETYTLRDNFRGLASADGLAEVFLTPELSLDLATTTAVFNVQLVDGELINFTPLKAAAKFLDNKDLNHVRFATFKNSFPLTLADSKIIVPLTIVESTIGQMLIEGEQEIDGSYLYLMRLPTWLVKGAARSRLSSAEDNQKEDQIQEYTTKTINYLQLTVWGEGEESEVKLGDRREKYR
jgi:hypothetical protein